jgi:hypothetical protein
MGNTLDIIKILLLVIMGMFIPFIGSLALAFNIDLLMLQGWELIITSFLYFLVFFGMELALVFVYYTLTNRMAQKSFQDISTIEDNEK